MSLRDSLPNTKQLPMAFFMAVATALGGGAVAVFSNWWGGLINQNKLDTALILKADASKISELEQMIGVLGDHPAVCIQLQSLSDSDLLHNIRWGMEIKERMSLQVGLYQTMRLAKLNEDQRTTIDRAIISSKSRHDFLVLQMRMTPSDAAKQVVDEYKVQTQR